ncbi:MAG TPA: hypothetical protein VFZ14_05455, partial [Burkholderiales bacterium]|nr:hypothetical protein [Burkholderiales bacterium]
HLFLYEHDRMCRQALAQNLKANGITNATLIRRRLRRSRPAGAAEAGRAPARDRFDSNAVSVEPEESIDELRLERVDWLKIDRGERAADVLEGAVETLWRLRPRLHVRVAAEEELRGVAARAGEFGYACWRSETPLFDPRNFNNRDVDLFSGRTALALIALPEERTIDAPLEGCSRIA